jgi:hypothetical protein
MQTPTTVPATVILDDAVATLRAEMYPRKLMRISINGPTGSRAEVFLGAITPSARIDQTARGFSNTAEFVHPVDVPSGMIVSVAWPGMGTRYVEASATFITERG